MLVFVSIDDDDVVITSYSSSVTVPRIPMRDDLDDNALLQSLEEYNDE